MKFLIYIGVMLLIHINISCKKNESSTPVEIQTHLLTWKCEKDYPCLQGQAIYLLDGKVVGRGLEGIDKLKKLKFRDDARIVIKRPWMMLEDKIWKHHLITCPSAVTTMTPYYNTGLLEHLEKIGVAESHTLTWTFPNNRYPVPIVTQYCFDGNAMGDENEVYRYGPGGAGVRQLDKMKLSRGSIIYLEGSRYSEVYPGMCGSNIVPFMVTENGIKLVQKWIEIGVTLEMKYYLD